MLFADSTRHDDFLHSHAEWGKMCGYRVLNVWFQMADRMPSTKRNTSPPINRVGITGTSIASNTRQPRHPRQDEHAPPDGGFAIGITFLSLTGGLVTGLLASAAQRLFVWFQSLIGRLVTGERPAENPVSLVSILTRPEGRVQLGFLRLLSGHRKSSSTSVRSGRPLWLLLSLCRYFFWRSGRWRRWRLCRPGGWLRLLGSSRRGFRLFFWLRSLWWWRCCLALPLAFLFDPLSPEFPDSFEPLLRYFGARIAHLESLAGLRFSRFHTKRRLLLTALLLSRSRLLTDFVQDIVLLWLLGDSRCFRFRPLLLYRRLFCWGFYSCFFGFLRRLFAGSCFLLLRCSSFGFFAGCFLLPRCLWWCSSSC